jgi:hypothetical protein
MSALIRAVGFSVVMILAFAAVTYVLPQVKGEAPEEEEVNLGELTIDSFVTMGEKLYKGKGTCTLCHNNLGRAPDMLTFDVHAASLQRIADSRYQGQAADVESYLRESMLQPSAYVVEGFGKKGSNDAERRRGARRRSRKHCGCARAGAKRRGSDRQVRLRGLPCDPRQQIPGRAEPRGRGSASAAGADSHQHHRPEGGDRSGIPTHHAGIPQHGSG